MALGGNVAGARRIPLRRYVPPRFHGRTGRSDRVLHAERHRHTCSSETRRLNQHFVNRGATGRVVVPTLFGTPARLTTGVDYQNTPITTGSFGRANTTLAGQTLSEVEESATTVGPFALVDAAARRPRLRHRRRALRPHHVLDREPDPSAGRPVRYRVRTVLPAPRPHVPADRRRGAVRQLQRGFRGADPGPAAQLAIARRRVRGQPDA